MNINYYKEYAQLEREHWWFQVRGKIISKLILTSIETNENKQLNILNIGAATGKTSEILSKFGKVTSLEYDKDCCDYAKQQFNMTIIHGSILELPFMDEEFDLVCAFDVIEHVEDDLLGINEMKRVCKIDGLLVLTVPAFMFLWSHHDEVNHHYRRYTLNNLKDLVKKAMENGVKMIACTMSMDVMGITEEELIDGVEYAGVGTYLGDAEESNVNLFI